MKNEVKQVPKGVSFTVDVWDGGYSGKCVYVRGGFADVVEAQAEIAKLKRKFALDGVDTTDYLYVIRPVETKEKELNTDLFAIMHSLTAPPARDDSEAEWERILGLDSAWVGFQNKYPQDMLDDIEDGLNHLIDCVTEKLNDGDYGDVNA